MVTPTLKDQITWLEQKLSGYNMRWDIPFLEAVLQSLYDYERYKNMDDKNKEKVRTEILNEYAVVSDQPTDQKDMFYL